MMTTKPGLLCGVAVTGFALLGAAQPAQALTAQECSAKYQAAKTAVFPNAVDAKYSKETAGKARMHTCLDAYNANKAGNGNGGMKWIQKGGGYYSECSKKLKGAA